MAHHGTTHPDNDFLAEERQLQERRIDEESSGQTKVELDRENGKLEAVTPQETSRATSMSGNSETRLVNEISGVPISSEKGQDVYVVDWSGPDDPDVCFVSHSPKETSG